MGSVLLRYLSNGKELLRRDWGIPYWETNRIVSDYVACRVRIVFIFIFIYILVTSYLLPLVGTTVFFPSYLPANISGQWLRSSFFCNVLGPLPHSLPIDSYSYFPYPIFLTLLVGLLPSLSPISKENCYLSVISFWVFPKESKYFQFLCCLNLALHSCRGMAGLTLLCLKNTSYFYRNWPVPLQRSHLRKIAMEKGKGDGN